MPPLARNIERIARTQSDREIEAASIRSALQGLVGRSAPAVEHLGAVGRGKVNRLDTVKDDPNGRVLVIVSTGVLRARPIEEARSSAASSGGSLNGTIQPAQKRRVPFELSKPIERVSADGRVALAMADAMLDVDALL